MRFEMKPNLICVQADAFGFIHGINSIFEQEVGRKVENLVEKDCNFVTYLFSNVELR